MVRKQNENYFDILVMLMEYSCHAASLLNDLMNSYNVDLLQESMQRVYDSELCVQKERTIIIEKLLNEFVTPIEREDIIILTNSLYNIHYAIGGVIKQLFALDIRKIKGYAKEMTQTIEKCCTILKQIFVELQNYKKSKFLHDLIQKVYCYNEECGKTFIEAVRDLHINTRNVVEISSWYQTYLSLKQCCDECQRAAKAVEYVVLKNI